MSKTKTTLTRLFALVLLAEVAAFLILAATGTMARHGAALVAGIMGANGLLALLAVGLVFRRRRRKDQGGGAAGAPR
jgi:hypothetical protein